MSHTKNFPIMFRPIIFKIFALLFFNFSHCFSQTSELNSLSDNSSVHEMPDAYPKTIKKQQQIVQFVKQQEESTAFEKTLNNLGLTYLALDNLEMAEVCFMQILNKTKQSNSPLAIHTTLGHLGVLFFKKQDYPTAMQYTKEALRIQQSYEMVYQQVKTYQLLAQIALAQGLKKNANKWIDSSIYLAQGRCMNTEIAHGYYIKSKVLASQKAYKSACNYLFRYDTLNKQLISQQHEKIATAITEKYENRELAAENTFQQFKIQENKQQLFLQKLGILIASVLAIVLLIITILIQKKRAIERKNLRLKSKHLEKIQAENKRLLDAKMRLKNDLENIQEKLTLLTETQEKLIKLSDKCLVKLEEIRFIRVEHKLLVFHLTEGRTVKLTDNLVDWEATLPSSIMPRIHKSCLVNLLHVQKRNYGFVLLFDGEKLSVGRSYTKEVKIIWSAWKNKGSVV